MIDNHNQCLVTFFLVPSITVCVQRYYLLDSPWVTCNACELDQLLSWMQNCNLSSSRMTKLTLFFSVASFPIYSQTSFKSINSLTISSPPLRKGFPDIEASTRPLYRKAHYRMHNLLYLNFFFLDVESCSCIASQRN